MKELLDSDRVNFLIWRYLLEANYRETAAKFQKEWHIQEPHRHFDFAPHIQTHALVSLINKGLVYQSIERDHRRKQLPQEDAAAAEALQRGVFGPLVAQPPRHAQNFDDEDLDADGEHEEENVPHPQDVKDLQTRKRQIDSRPQHAPGEMNGVPAKKPKLTNGLGYENRADSATTPMDIDPSHGGTGENNNAYPSPLEGEQAPTPIPRTEGPEQGTQVDKVQELTPFTTFLRLTHDDIPEATSPSSVNEISENAPIVLHCEWNPADPSVLAAAGTDALARIWTISRAPAPGPANEHLPNHVSTVIRPGRSLLEGAPTTVTVTSLAWNKEGTALALATDEGSRGRVIVYNIEGDPYGEFSVPEPPVIKVRWNPTNTALLTVSPDSQGVAVTVFHLGSDLTLKHVQNDPELQHYSFDATWTSETDLLLCGANIMLSLHCSESGIVLTRKFETRPDDHFTQVLFDGRSKLAATSSDKGILDLWDEAGQRRSITAHQGQITALEWQPLQSSPAADERLIASGGDDCAISIWNARIPENKAKCVLTMDNQIVALAFTPDGAFIAGATGNKVLIWKVGDHAMMPRASWSRTPHPGWLSPRQNSETEDEDQHCLCWDSTGQKLAYGANSRLAVMDFR